MGCTAADAEAVMAGEAEAGAEGAAAMTPAASCCPFTASILPPLRSKLLAPALPVLLLVLVPLPVPVLVLVLLVLVLVLEL